MMSPCTRRSPDSWRALIGRSVLGAVLLPLLAGSAPGAPTISSTTIGESAEGRAVTVLTVGEPGEDALGRSIDERPALVIIAGAQGDHTIGTLVGTALAERLVNEHAEMLAQRTVYIVPMLNPDGMGRFESRRPYVAASGRAPVSMDADRDGRMDEDPPNDLNGDGVITLMRVPAPNARYGIGATHIIDPDDPRIVRAPSGDDAMAATHAILIEGIDDDGDGSFNEDGWGGASGGGVDFDMHFPTHWPEHADGAGLYPLERAETLALARWLQSRTNIIAAVVYGPHDTVVSIPATGQFGPERRVPTGIEDGDKPVYEVVSKEFKEITGITKSEDGPSRNGSLVQWLYADLGVYAFGTPVWVRPDLVKSGDGDSKANESGDGGGAGANGGDAGAGSERESALQRERDSLLERGVPVMIIEFLQMDADTRAAEIASFENASEEEQSAMMATVAALPEDVRARVMALAQGGADPSPAAAPAEAGGGGDAGERSGRGGREKGSDSPDAKWLAWLDERGDDGGFIAWKSFEHPQLGMVEIGGFRPGVRVNPPGDLVDPLIAQQTEFVAGVLERFPVLEVGEPVVERVGGGVWRVSVSMTNTGGMPTVSAIGEKTRRIHRLTVALDPDGELELEQILSGSRVAGFGAIAPHGGSERAEWLIAAEAGSEVTIEVRSARFGWRRMGITLEGN
ncbi:MAG: M14 family zinc carboxypeptidase [Phycisphaerales bacterium]